MTGLGVTAPLGTGVETFWPALKRGECGIGPIESFDTQDLYITIAGEIKDFDPRALGLSKPLLLADRYSQLAGWAAQEAVAQSGLTVPFEHGPRAAAIVGTGAGGLTTLERGYYDMYVLKKAATHPLTLLRTIGSSAAAHIGIEYGVKGPTFATMSACSTASHAIGLVFQMIRAGQVDLGIAGASEAVLTYGSMRSWQALRVLSDKGCYPFSRTRNGTVLAEGAGILVLESLDYAKARGATILAEVMGYGTTADAADMVNPDIEGASEAMRLALEDARLAPSDIDYVNAHGTATAVNDVNETDAIRRVFGKAAYDLAVSSTKSMHGHCLGAAGGVEAVIAVKAIEEDFVPPTIGYAEPDPRCDLDYTPNEGRAREVNYVLSNSFAFGGLNAVLVFGPPPA